MVHLFDEWVAYKDRGNVGRTLQSWGQEAMCQSSVPWSKPLTLWQAEGVSQSQN